MIDSPVDVALLVGLVLGLAGLCAIVYFGIRDGKGVGE